MYENGGHFACPDVVDYPLLSQGLRHELDSLPGALGPEWNRARFDERATAMKSDLEALDTFYYFNFEKDANGLYIIGGRIPIRLDRVAYNFQAGDNSFSWMRTSDRETQSISSRLINSNKFFLRLSDPAMPAASEEFLHGAEVLIRKQAENPFDEMNTFNVLKHAAHASCLIDAVLTRAAMEMGKAEYLHWYNHSRFQTGLDGLNLFPDRELFGNTLLGKSINERFQYPFVTRQYITNMIVNFINDVHTDWFVEERKLNLLLLKNGQPPGGKTSEQAVLELSHEEKVNRSLFARMQYAMLAYGEYSYPMMMKLLECGQVRNQDRGRIGIPNQTVVLENAAEEAIELGKQWLTYFKSHGMEKELVRHHTPYSRPLRQTEFEYEIPQTAIEIWNLQQNKKLPIVVPYNEILGMHNVLGIIDRAKYKQYFPMQGEE